MAEPESGLFPVFKAASLLACSRRTLARSLSSSCLDNIRCLKMKGKQITRINDKPVSVTYNAIMYSKEELTTQPDKHSGYQKN